MEKIFLVYKFNIKGNDREKGIKCQINVYMYEIEVQEASTMSRKGKACFGKFITIFLDFAGPPRKNGEITQ